MTRWNTVKTDTSEFDEQCKLAEYLDMKNYCWCHVPNGGNRSEITGSRMKKQGTKKGVPDNFIFDGPEEHKGIVIELKRVNGGRLTPEQKCWLNELKKRGWITKVCHGADEAIDFIERLERDIRTGKYGT